MISHLAFVHFLDAPINIFMQAFAQCGNRNLAAMPTAIHILHQLSQCLHAPINILILINHVLRVHCLIVHRLQWTSVTRGHRNVHQNRPLAPLRHSTSIWIIRFNLQNMSSLLGHCQHLSMVCFYPLYSYES